MEEERREGRWRPLEWETEKGGGGESPSPVEASRHEGLKIDGAGERWKEGQAQTEKERGGEYGTDVASWREWQARNEQGGHHHEQPLRQAPPFGAVAQEALLGPVVTSPALGRGEVCGGWWGLGQCFFPTGTEVFWIGRLDTTWLIRHALAEPQLRDGHGRRIK